MRTPNTPAHLSQAQRLIVGSVDQHAIAEDVNETPAREPRGIKYQIDIDGADVHRSLKIPDPFQHP